MPSDQSSRRRPVACDSKGHTTASESSGGVSSVAREVGNLSRVGRNILPIALWTAPAWGSIESNLASRWNDMQPEWSSVRRRPGFPRS